jgi:hypothetical protein
LLTADGYIDFTTPTSVLKKSKRFSLLGMDGLRSVDFTSNNFFNEGVKICSWVVDKTYKSNVEIICEDEITHQSKDKLIYDYNEIDTKFIKLYESLKLITEDLNERMFSQNNVGSAFSNVETKNEFKYPIYKIKKGEIIFNQWNKRKPYFYGLRKFVISMTSGFSESAIAISTKDFNVGHLCIDINNDIEIENIKSFIFSDYFTEHSQKWKNIDQYGYNYSLKYLPPFDKTKSWTNEEVKEFIESFIL